MLLNCLRGYLGLWWRPGRYTGYMWETSSCVMTPVFFLPLKPCSLLTCNKHFFSEPSLNATRLLASADRQQVLLSRTAHSANHREPAKG